MNSTHNRLRMRLRRQPPRGPGRPTREQSEYRNQELLDQALDLFLEHGFEATTIELISDSMRMSRRTIYARYGDKTELFKAALQRAIDEWVVPLERLRAAECDDLEETLIRVGRMWGATTSESRVAFDWCESRTPNCFACPRLPSTFGAARQNLRSVT